MQTKSKRLIVLRHASSSPAAPGGSDHDRVLDEVGVDSAPRVGARLAELGWTPASVLCSTARRAQQTWAELKGALVAPAPPDCDVRQELYLADPDRITTLLAQAPEAADTAMVVAHNPGLEELVDLLSQVRVRMLPCTAALLQVSAEDWATACGRADWELVSVVRPDAL